MKSAVSAGAQRAGSHRICWNRTLRLQSQIRSGAPTSQNSACLEEALLASDPWIATQRYCQSVESVLHLFQAGTPVGRPPTGVPAFPVYTLNRKRTMSPSFITYSLPSERTRPFSLAADMEPHFFRSSKAMTSARIKPRSKSEWIFPAAWGALVPSVMVQARHSSSPPVR